MSPRLAVTSACIVVGALLGAGGCDTNDGRTLDPPAPGATAPTVPPSTTSTSTVASVGVGTGTAPPVDLGLHLESPDFAAGTAIPGRFSCDGAGTSPALTWEGVPAGAAELVVVVRDPDATDAPGGEFVHWIVAGIDPVVLGFAEGGLPETAVEVQRWVGPCPPPGETHNYVFELFVLPQPLDLAPGSDPQAAIAAISAAFTQTATFSATYGRPA